MIVPGTDPRALVNILTEGEPMGNSRDDRRDRAVISAITTRMHESVPRLEWIKTPGRVSEITATAGDSGLYAKTSDGHYHVWVSRRMAGYKGRRSYEYTFSVYDRKKGRDVQLPLTARSDPKKVFAAVEKFDASESASLVKRFGGRHVKRTTAR
jgi:hypothetical protein